MGKIKSYVHLHSLNLHLFLTLKIDQVEGKKKICNRMKLFCLKKKKNTRFDIISLVMYLKFFH